MVSHFQALDCVLVFSFTKYNFQNYYVLFVKSYSFLLKCALHNELALPLDKQT